MLDIQNDFKWFDDSNFAALKVTIDFCSFHKSDKLYHKVSLTLLVLTLFQPSVLNPSKAILNLSPQNDAGMFNSYQQDISNNYAKEADVKFVRSFTIGSNTKSNCDDLIPNIHNGDRVRAIGFANLSFNFVDM